MGGTPTPTLTVISHVQLTHLADSNSPTSPAPTPQWLPSMNPTPGALAQMVEMSYPGHNPGGQPPIVDPPFSSIRSNILIQSYGVKRASIVLEGDRIVLGKSWYSLNNSAQPIKTKTRSHDW
jgi:hypothetical protein